MITDETNPVQVALNQLRAYVINPDEPDETLSAVLFDGWDLVQLAATGLEVDSVRSGFWAALAALFVLRREQRLVELSLTLDARHDLPGMLDDIFGSLAADDAAGAIAMLLTLLYGIESGARAVVSSSTANIITVTTYITQLLRRGGTDFTAATVRLQQASGPE